MSVEPTPPTEPTNTTNQAETTATPAKSRRRRSYKISLIVLCTLVTLFVLVIALLPTFISTHYGTRTALSFVNQAIPGSVQAQSLSMGWLNGLTIDELTIHTQDQQEALSIQSIQMPRTSLFSLASIAMGWQTEVELVTQQGKINTRLLQSALASEETMDEEMEDDVLHLPSHVSWVMDLRDYQLTFESEHASAVEVLLTSASVDSPSPAQFAAQLDASMTQDHRTGEFKLNASIRNLFDERGRSQYDKADMDVTLETTSLPVTLLDELLAAPDDFMRALLGPELAADVQMKGTMNDLRVNLQAQSETLEAHGSIAIKNEFVTIHESPSLTLNLLPRAVTALNPEYELHEPVKIRLALDRFEPGDSDGENLSDLAFAFSFSMDPATLTMPDVGVVATEEGVRGTLESHALRENVVMAFRSDITVNDARGMLETDVLLSELLNDEGKLDFANTRVAIDGGLREAAVAELLDSMLNLGDLVQVALQGPMTLTWQGDVALDHYTPRVGSVDVSASAQNIKGDVKARLTPDQFTMEPGQLLTLTVTPALADRLAKLIAFESEPEAGQPSLGLTESATLILVLNELTIPRQGMNANIAQAALQTKLTIQSLYPKGFAALEGAGLRDFEMELSSRRLSEDASMQLNSQMIYHNQTAGRLTGQGGVNVTANPNEVPQFKLRDLDLTLSDFSVAMLEQIVALPVGLQPALGETLEQVAVNINARSASAQTSSREEAWDYGYTIDAQDPELGLNIDLNGLARYDTQGTALRMNPQSVIAANLSEDRINTYMRDFQEDPQQTPPWRATSSARLNVKFTKLDFARPADETQPTQLAMNIEATTSPIRMTNTQQQTLSVDDFKATLVSEQFDQQIDLTVSGTIREKLSDDAPARSASLDSQTSVLHPFADRSAPTGEHRMIRTNTHVPSFPVALLEPFTTQGKELIAVLGETATLDLTGELPGNLNVSINSPNLQTSLKANLDRDRVLTLAENFTGTLQITPEMAKVFLGQLHPVLADAMGSERPVQWVVRPYNPETQRPLQIDLMEPLDLTKLDISGQLDLGAIRMKRRGWLKQSILSGAQAIIRILSLGVRLPDTSEGETYLANFTPMEFTLTKGIFRSRQLWIYAEDMVVGFQGSVDLNKHSYDMVMGVVGVTFLAGGPALFSQIIDPTNIFDIPVSGRQGEEPRIDWGIMSIYLAGSAGRVQLDNTLGRLPGIGGIGVGLIGAIGSGVQDEIRRSKQIEWNMPQPVEQAVERIRVMVRGKKDPTQQQQQEEAPAPTAAEQPAEESAPADDETTEQNSARERPVSRLLDRFLDTRERDNEKQSPRDSR